MGEALIIRSGGGSQSSGGYVPKTVLINSNQTWTVPKAKNQEFMVRIFGAGGRGNTVNSTRDPTIGADVTYRTGGGGGNMNNALLKLNVGEVITISIGNIGYTNGGTTSFGTYLSATGGEISIGQNGGNGGTGGGGFRKGGDGYYGGGGSGMQGGNGGTYGGGGAGMSKGGISLGGYGNGGDKTNNATDGLNTINIAGTIDFPGYGKAGKGYGGGGGYGGNGGANFGGGGGYGGDGGSGYQYHSGGGGGYGNNGANGVAGSDGVGDRYHCCGGGGGYGLEGYGHGGGTYDNLTYMYLQPPKAGVCIITYMEPVQ